MHNYNNFITFVHIQVLNRNIVNKNTYRNVKKVKKRELKLTDVRLLARKVTVLEVLFLFAERVTLALSR
jgi:hypothetical protein